MPIPTVREAREEDAEALLELWRQLSGRPELPDVSDTVKSIVLMAAQPWMHLLAAEVDGVVVGTATIAIVPTFAHSRPWAQIEHVVVHEKYRRRGIGKALMRRCEELAREADAYMMQLASSNFRKEAHAFYASQGLEPSSVGFRKWF